jgi:hypothetical protein
MAGCRFFFSNLVWIFEVYRFSIWLRTAVRNVNASGPVRIQAQARTIL